MTHRSYDRLVPELWRQRIHLARGSTDVFRPCFRETGSIQIHMPKPVGTSISLGLHGDNIGHQTALDYYTPDTRDMVGEIYRQDLELFGYEFA